MATKKKMLQAAAGNAGGGAGLDITDVFSTYLYEGDGLDNNDIVNNVDLATEGGMVWLKWRNSSNDHYIHDTERGASQVLITNDTTGQINFGTSLTSFNTDGFTTNGNNGYNGSGNSMASWTFRKAPKFFDVVTWTGNGVAGREIPHNLGSTPGTIIVKKTAGGFADGWMVNHRSIPSTQFVTLNGTQAATTSSTRWDDTDPTDTVFTVGDDTSVNASGSTYVAFIFAHNDGDGEFGPDGDQDIIKCGSYTGDGTTNKEVTLGFEPQWIMIKGASGSVAEYTDWVMYDTMRGMVVTTGGDDRQLYANNNNGEDWVNRLEPTPTGFRITNTNINQSANNFIYMAIRRGPLAPPESATEVFSLDYNSSAQSSMTTGFPVDTLLQYSDPTNGGEWAVFDRLRGVSTTASELHNRELQTQNTNAEGTRDRVTYNWGSEGIGATEWGSGFVAYAWKRAPNFFDVVAYSGNSTAGRAVSHNLGVAPEMIWMKCRTNTQAWQVYHKDLDANGQGAAASGLGLNLNIPEANTGVWNSTSPTDTSFYLNAEDKSNETGQDYIAYLFASVDGVSKVGSYTSDGTNGKVIDCGFTNGARFVLIKGASVTTDWLVWDSERGIVAGNDPYLELNTTDAEEELTDYIDPHSSGFIVNTGVNFGTHRFIFYAIA